ncbi:MAG: alginate O-acetyltransferase AlgX-related protein [Chthoniobacterales bacterium]
MRAGLLLSFGVALTSLALGAGSPAENVTAFRRFLADKVATLEKQNAAACAGTDGWLFLTSELRFLSRDRFWGDAAAKVAHSRRPESADPLPAILDFHRQLHERGIELILVPVPPKAAIFPEKIAPQIALDPTASAPALTEFYAKLREQGIDVLDLSALFARNRESPRGSVYCRTDSHWSGIGCALAGEAIAKEIRAKVAALPAAREYAREWKVVSISGDLAGLVPPAQKPGLEQIAVRQLASAIKPEPNSPVLLLGDSHTLVFHDFLAERAGLLDQLTAELGFVPDLIGTRGSGATPVRVSLFRRTRSDPQFLAKKKVVVWCFAAREFTEADQGWVVQPIAK